MQRRGKSEASGAGADVSSSTSANTYHKHKSKSRTSFGAWLAAVPIALVCLLIALAIYVVPAKPNHLSPNTGTVRTGTGTSIATDAVVTAQTNVAPTTPATTRKTSGTGSIGVGSDVNYHIIFSTSCSTFQDWQSYVFFHQALVSGQPGTVTRIVSGCEEEDELKARQVFQEQIEPMAPGRFKIHFTPDYATVKKGVKFTYFNKPFGTKHWLENAMGHPGNPLDEDAIVVLMDPDQLIMRPFVNNDFSNERWVHLREGAQPRTRIDHGFPMGQLYGFGLQWKTKVNMTHISPNEPSPVDELTAQESREGYAVGPPYIATARDMYTIVVKWCEFGPRVHDMYPFLLAEMFAYCLAAAHTKLPHQIAASFMISDVSAGSKAEGWGYIDSMPQDKVCGKHSPEDLPHVIHFCQRYGVGDYYFGKRRLPKDILTCESPLLAEPPEDLVGKYDYADWPGGKELERKQLKPIMAKRNGFVLCYMLPAINEAAIYFKQRHCAPGTANLNKTLLVNQVK